MDQYSLMLKSLELEKKAGEKIGVEVRQHLLLYLQFATNGTFSQSILKNDRILLEMRILIAERHNKLFDLIDRKMQQLFEGGLFYVFTELTDRRVNEKRGQKYKEPFKVLTFDELEAGFVVCFTPLLFGVVAFCLEWLVVLIEHTLVKCILEAFFRIHRSLLNEQSKNLDLKITAWNKIVKERQDQVQASLNVNKAAMWRKIVKKHRLQWPADTTRWEVLMNEAEGELEDLISDILEKK